MTTPIAATIAMASRMIVHSGASGYAGS